MAKRILLGKAANADYGLYVSKSGTDVVDGSNNIATATNLMFDSRVGIGCLNLKYHGQGLLGVPGNNLSTATDLNTSDTYATITHNLGFVPFVIVQWCFQSDLSSGVATKMYPASLDFNAEANRSFAVFGSQYNQKGLIRGGVNYSVNSTTLTITNNFIGQIYISTVNGFESTREYQGGESIAYAFLIFDLQGA